MQDMICRRQTVQATAQAAPSARGGRQGRKGLVGNGQGEREVRGATWAVGGGTWQVIARVKHHRAERRCGLRGAGGRQRGACWVLSGGRAERCRVGGQGTGSCGCRFHVVVGRMQCASARALESGLLLPAEQPHSWGQCIWSARLLKQRQGLWSEVLRSVSLFVGFILSYLILMGR